MTSMCGTDCCDRCERRTDCGGCVQTDGHPFGGTCIAAESIRRGGMAEFLRLKDALIAEFNALSIPGLQIDDLHLLNGFYVNLAYPVAGEQPVKLLSDADVYWGNQVEIPGSNRCYGLVADERYLLVSEYGCNGDAPQIVVYKRRAGAAQARLPE